MTDSPVIRAADASDADAISTLVAELGYVSTGGEIPGRLATLEASGRAVAMVAELERRIVGLITAHMLATLHHTQPVAWITTLVVTDRARGSGVGRLLVRHVEDWARASGAVRMSVTSGSQRADAHEFYRRIGYEQTGVRFGRML